MKKIFRNMNMKNNDKNHRLYVILEKMRGYMEDKE